jgi:hypothetical protein
MAPPKLTPKEKRESIKKRKAYLREYHKGNTEQKRIYNRTYRQKQIESKQLLKNE